MALKYYVQVQLVILEFKNCFTIMQSNSLDQDELGGGGAVLQDIKLCFSIIANFNITIPVSLRISLTKL
jgi:hypothetical protein